MTLNLFVLVSGMSAGSLKFNTLHLTGKMRMLLFYSKTRSEGKKTFSGTQTFIDQQFTLLTKAQTEKPRIFLDPSVYDLTFPFRIKLQEKLPSR
jgi:hypothetical protein